MANLKISLRKKGTSNFEGGDKLLPETDWSFILNKPATFVPDPHGHAISEITGLQTALNGKAASTHNHSISQVTGLQLALDGKAESDHTHNISHVYGLQDTLDGKVNLSGAETISGLKTFNDGIVIPGQNNYIDLGRKDNWFWTRFSGENWTFNNTFTGGGWARNLMEMKDDAKPTANTYFRIGAQGSGQNFTHMYIGPAFNDYWLSLNNSRALFGVKPQYASDPTANNDLTRKSYVDGKINNLNLDDIEDGSTYKRVTETDKNNWNLKADITDIEAKIGDYDSQVVSPGLASKLSASLKGSANGLAELDGNGKVPSSQLPSFVDDVLEFASLSSFPTPGESGKIYIDKATNKTYRWGGSDYVVISDTIALGETSSTAYRGDRGKIAYDHSQLPHAPSNAQKNSDITKAEIEAKLTGAITTHTHPISHVTGLQTALDGKAASGHTHTWGQITGKPDVIIEGDSRLTNSRPASDVQSWAKSSQSSAENRFLRVNSNTAYWRTAQQMRSDLGLGSLATYNTIALNDLTGVTYDGTPTAGQVLSYGAGTWYNTKLGVSDITGLQTQLNNKATWKQIYAGTSAALSKTTSTSISVPSDNYAGKTVAIEIRYGSNSSTAYTNKIVFVTLGTNTSASSSKTLPRFISFSDFDGQYLKHISVKCYVSTGTTTSISIGRIRTLIGSFSGTTIEWTTQDTDDISVYIGKIWVLE